MGLLRIWLLGRVDGCLCMVFTLLIAFGSLQVLGLVCDAALGGGDVSFRVRCLLVFVLADLVALCCLTTARLCFHWGCGIRLCKVVFVLFIIVVLSAISVALVMFWEGSYRCRCFCGWMCVGVLLFVALLLNGVGVLFTLWCACAVFVCVCWLCFGVFCLFAV